MLTVLREATFAPGTLRQAPYRWAVLSPVFADPVTADSLAETFPIDLLQPAARTDGTGGKQYVMLSYSVMAGSRWVADMSALTAPWPALLAELAGKGYRDALARTVGVDLSDCQVEIRLCAYPAAGWLSAHTDRADKVVTQVIYLNSEWRADCGGHLNVLSSCDEADVYARVPPLLDNSVVFVRSDASWHSVSPVRAGLTAQRRSVLVHFIRP